METAVKKISHLARGGVTYADYALFRLLRLFRRRKPFPGVSRIIVVERLFFGDLIVITPVLRALKQRFPEAEIDILIQPSMVDVLGGNPDVSRIIPCSDADISDNPEKVVRELKGRYDLGVVLNYGSYSISRILRDAKVKYRIGSTKAGLLAGRGFFMDRKTKPTFRTKHKVEHHMDVVRSIGVDIDDKHLEVYIPNSVRSYMQKLLLKHKISKKDFVVAMHPGPAHMTHRWNPVKFAKVADYLVRKRDAKIVFTGAEKDSVLIGEIMSFMRSGALNMAGKTSVKEYFALIERADVLISVDTSAMHVGAAVSTPTVALFGAGDPRMWRPYGDMHVVVFKERDVCTSCMRHSCNKDMECMRAIKVHDVLRAFDEAVRRGKIFKKGAGGS